MNHLGPTNSAGAEPAALNNIRHAEAFYDLRYQAGYMQDDDWSPEKLQRVLELIRELRLPETGRVLDYGCGTGVFTAALRAALPRWEVVGTDVSRQALLHASARLPQVTFLGLADCEKSADRFDLIFTHHVLEHVSDLAHTADVLANALAPSGTMLHILPCGNAGSFAHSVCGLVKNGIDANNEGRFFFEEVGHLRRLTTRSLIDLWSECGLLLDRAYYAEQFFGAVNSATQFDLDFVRQFVDPSLAKDRISRAKLRWLRAGLVCVWFLRKPASVVRYKMRHGCSDARDVALLTGGVVLYPISAACDWIVRSMTSWEWRTRRTNDGGAEMYVVLVRGSR